MVGGVGAYTACKVSCRDSRNTRHVNGSVTRSTKTMLCKGHSTATSFGGSHGKVRCIDGCSNSISHGCGVTRRTTNPNDNIVAILGAIYSGDASFKNKSDSQPSGICKGKSFIVARIARGRNCSSSFCHTGDGGVSMLPIICHLPNTTQGCCWRGLFHFKSRKLRPILAALKKVILDHITH